MDISMPELTGIEATREIKASMPDANVVGLTMHSDDRYFFALLDAGAAGYVVKGGAPHELIDAVRAAARGDAYIHPSLAGILIQGFARRAQQSPTDSNVDLTPREKEVARLIADGKTGREIAETLVISPNTVDRHRTNIMTKLHMHNKAELVRYAVEQGFV
jgi:DNA-binding NarL/FixJ family response regulator